MNAPALAQSDNRTANTEAKAAQWVDFFADHADVPCARLVRAHLRAGRITRLCECGCNSFDVEIPDGVVLEAMSPPGQSGVLCQVGRLLSRWCP